MGVVTAPAHAQPTIRRCRSCGRLYGDDYTQWFCVCGKEILTARPAERQRAIDSRFKFMSPAERQAESHERTRRHNQAKLHNNLLDKAAGLL